MVPSGETTYVMMSPLWTPENSLTFVNQKVCFLFWVSLPSKIKNNYRKFNIKQKELDARDDTAILKQVLRRRFNKNKKANYIEPDLIIIDGGKGQLSAASQILGELNIENLNYICISKGIPSK